MSIYFTADTHFGHARILELCARPYQSIEEMDDDLIRRWNDVVAADDTVYHLGDLTLGGPETASRYLARLSGHLRVVPGGHDERWAKPGREYRTQSGPVQVLPPLAEVKLAGTHLVLCHYSLREWEGSFHGVLHLHGHTHGRLVEPPGSVDVGVDVFTAPVSLEDLVGRVGPRSLGQTVSE